MQSTVSFRTPRGLGRATSERLIELERQAAKAARQPAAYTDVTVSFSKSISVLHASIRENTRRARLAGDQRAEAYWAGLEARIQEIQQSTRAEVSTRRACHACAGRGSCADDVPVDLLGLQMQLDQVDEYGLQARCERGRGDEAGDGGGV